MLYLFLELSDSTKMYLKKGKKKFWLDLLKYFESSKNLSFEK